MAIITVYNPLPISFEKGKGIWLYDETGEKYLDSFAGIAVSGLGHSHPIVTKTIKQQAAKLLHTSNAFQIKKQLELAEKLISLTAMKQAVFNSTGSEANETAIKISRLYGHKKGIEKPAIIVMDGAYHGLTMATLTASGNRKAQAGFEPLVPGFIRAPFNDIEAIKTIASNRSDITAIMVEPIQGESGVIVAKDEYMVQLATICKEKDWLLIVDEVQTGNGRTGKFFAYMHSDILPDIVTTAKGLGNGIPISVCLINDKACDLLKPGTHKTTFGGNPLACATALTVLEVIEHDQLCEKVEKNSVYLKRALEKKLKKHPAVRSIRGKGYMLGIELDRPAMDVKKTGLEKKILLNVVAENVIRLLPPLNASKKELGILVERLVDSITTFCH